MGSSASRPDRSSPPSTTCICARTPSRTRRTSRRRGSLDEAEHRYRLDMLDPMSANLVALARMASGQVAEAVPVYEELVARIPDMSFPISSLLRAHAFLQDWPAVDRLLAL